MAADVGEIGRRWQGNFCAIVTPLLVVLGLSADCAGSDPIDGRLSRRARWA